MPRMAQAPDLPAVRLYFLWNLTGFTTALLERSPDATFDGGVRELKARSQELPARASCVSICTFVLVKQILLY